MNVSKMIEAALPMKVGGVEASEPFFSLFSDAPRWSLGVACPWIIKGPQFEYDSEMVAIDDFDNVVRKLDGRVIKGIELGDDLIDPVFFFEGGLTLSLHADTNLDPWVLSLPGSPVILVGLAP